jgi:hypothetical protein
MTDRHEVLGRADPLGHIFLVEKHGSHSRMTDSRDGAGDGFAFANEDEPCSRSAKSIVLSARTRISTGF